jgi:FAD/FMN-containing dehydrogenase
MAVARKNGIILRMRGGRHSMEGYSPVSGGIVLDVSRMKAINEYYREYGGLVWGRGHTCRGEWRTAEA